MNRISAVMPGRSNPLVDEPHIARTDSRFLKDWEASLEARMLDLPDLGDRESGALFTIDRHLGDHFEVGVGYSFAVFSDDRTDLHCDHLGLFLNLVRTLRDGARSASARLEARRCAATRSRDSRRCHATS